MSTRLMGEPGEVQDKVLLLSQRQLAHLVAYCIGYEFEDTVAAITNATRIDTKNFSSLEFSRRFYKLAHLVTGSSDLSGRLAPAPRGSTVLETNYDLFFPVFNHTYELYALATIPNWRQRCRKAACYITEVWSDMLPDYLVELLSRFDHIFIGCRNAVQAIAQMTGRPCSYLAPAADVLRFTPVSLNKSRPIDVCYIGRRSEITHRAILEEAAHQQLFYYYDTVAASGTDLKHRTFQVDNASDHRRLLASLLKHSRYFVANRSYVNRPEFTAGRDEISPRFYEGAAAGTVMLGEAPRTDEFRRQFDWPDAVIHVPFDSPNIGDILEELNSDPERLDTIRRNNALQTLLRHDWLHRLQVVFQSLDLAPTEKMQARARQLEQIAAQI